MAKPIRKRASVKCDRICENVHSSHIQFSNFEDPQNLLGMMDTLETFRSYRATIPLSFLQMLDLCIVLSGFYESMNEKNRMCELCTFSQIRSQICLHILEALFSDTAKSIKKPYDFWILPFLLQKVMNSL